MPDKPKTTDELKIEVAEYFGKIKEFKECRHSLVESGSTKGSYSIEPSFTWKWETIERLGPYLKIEDESPWSATNILALLGYRVIWNNAVGYWYMIEAREFTALDSNGYDTSINMLIECYGQRILADKKGTQIILAHNLAIMHRHKEDIKNGTTFVNDVLRGL